MNKINLEDFPVEQEEQEEQEEIEDYQEKQGEVETSKDTLMSVPVGQSIMENKKKKRTEIDKGKFTIDAYGREKPRFTPGNKNHLIQRKQILNKELIKWCTK
jgi:hypothetical protein